MKTTIDQVVEKFDPITISITIESAEEAELLADLISVLAMPPRVEALYNNVHGDDGDEQIPYKFCDELFPPRVYTKLREAVRKAGKGER